MIENRLKKGLGRGLASLIGDSSKKIETNKVSINNLTRNKFQPRKNFSKESLEVQQSQLAVTVEELKIANERLLPFVKKLNSVL